MIFKFLEHVIILKSSTQKFNLEKYQSFIKLPLRGAVPLGGPCFFPPLVSYFITLHHNVSNSNIQINIRTGNLPQTTSYPKHITEIAKFILYH